MLSGIEIVRVGEENYVPGSSGDEEVSEDWSTSYFLPLLSPLFLLLDIKFLYNKSMIEHIPPN